MSCANLKLRLSPISTILMSTARQLNPKISGEMKDYGNRIQITYLPNGYFLALLIFIFD